MHSQLGCATMATMRGVAGRPTPPPPVYAVVLPFGDILANLVTNFAAFGRNSSGHNN